jgi:hypothetical protein
MDECRFQKVNDWPLVLTAIGAILGPFIAVAALVIEGRRLRRQVDAEASRMRQQLDAEASRMRLQLGVDNMWRLIEKWESLPLLKARAEAAADLLANWENRHELPNSALAVLDTFELLAYLVVRSQTLSLDDAWVNFSAYAIQWWHVSRPGIRAFQEDDPTIYEDFSSLADQFMTLESERRNKSREDLQPSDDDLIAYLQGERALLDTVGNEESDSGAESDYDP